MSDEPSAPAGLPAGHRFFADEDFEFDTLGALGRTAYRLTETGEVLATVATIADGDLDSWFDAWEHRAEHVARHADEARRAGHEQTARDAYLRASSYLGLAFFYVLGTRDPSRTVSVWRRHRHWFDEALRRWPTPVEPVSIPYEQTELTGYFFSGGPGPRPVVVYHNGSDGPMPDMLQYGVPDAVARGYHALLFDGPGQGQALYEQGLPFRYDWEAVITPVVDWLVGRADVQADRIAVFGCSQAGYWVPRAAAFEHRLAAIVVDPGVVRVQTSWVAHLPQFMLDDYRAAKRDEFDSMVDIGMQSDARMAAMLRKRLEPYGLTSMYDALAELERWDLTDVAGAITCPVLITEPDGEQFWPGQSRELRDLVRAPVTLAEFRTADGGNWHCEPMTPVVRSQRVLDWLDGVLRA